MEALEWAGSLAVVCLRAFLHPVKALRLSQDCLLLNYQVTILKYLQQAPLQ